MKNGWKQGSFLFQVMVAVFFLTGNVFAAVTNDLDQGMQYLQDKQYQKALPLIQKAADEGNVKAMYQMGELYSCNCDFYDPDKAVYWYRKAADHGNTDAFVQMGKLYFSKLDDDRAARYFWEGATAGNATAQQHLGMFCKNGWGVQSPEPALAVEWFKKSAENGCALGMVSYAEMLFQGIGVERNDWEAVKWFEKASQLKVEHASVLLAYMKELGRGTPRDLQGAIAIYTQFARQHALAAYRLGRLYERGEGVSKDMDKALDLYVEARHIVSPGIASSASYEAALRLGQCYANGIHVPKDEEKALKYFYLAKEGGLHEAFYHIGEFYEAGRFVRQDKPTAIKWYVLAEKAGHPQAAEKIRMLVSSSAQK